MNKKAGVSSIQLIAVIGFMAVLGLAIWGISSINQPPQTTVIQQAQTETGVQPITALVSCTSDGTTDGQIRYEDSLATTTTYKNNTAYFVSSTSGVRRVTTGQLQTDGTYSTAVDLKCTEAGIKWRAVAVTQKDKASSVDEGIEFVSEGAYIKRDIIGKALDSIKFKIEDKVTGGAKYFNLTGGYDADGTIGYIDSNGSTISIRNNGDTGTSLTLGADDYIDARIYVKTNNTKTQFGEDGLKTWLLIDADTSEYDEPIVARDAGASLVNHIADLQSEDRKKYSGYEYAYELGSISDRESYIDFYVQSASGVNPSADPIIEFCAEGRYDSVKQKDTILIGCWTDAATQAEVATTNRLIATFIVS